MAASRSKRNLKRSSSPLNISGTSSKKKKVIPAIEDFEYASNSPSSFTTVENSIYNHYGQFVFKDVNFEHSGVNSTKKRLWKNLKQVVALERTLPWKQDDPTYNSIEAPPSFKPAKKYCDITGLPAEIAYVIEQFFKPVHQAKYKDPQTRMLYSTSEEFLTIRNLPMDIIGGYLTLRKASPT